jgi:BirA family biotin operon repressor/biotin-[acetyl-CoA-carboxylase] ligase
MGLNEKLVSVFHNHPGKYLSGEELAEKLGVSRTTIWKHIHLLEDLGYQFTAQTNLGYKLEALPDRMLAQEIALRLETRFIGKKIHCFDTVKSTNDIALEMAADGEPEGSVIVAERQTQGRGRFGRKWFSPAGRNLILSLILRPPLAPRRVSQLGITAAVSVAVSLRRLFNLPALIKWPNDIYIGDKKAGGILTELSAELDCIHHAVVGIGVNLNVQKHEIPPSLRRKCTSVRIETGRKCDRIAALAALLNELEERYRRLLNEGFSPIIDEWMDLSLTLGRQIEVRSEGRTLTGHPTGLDLDGSLLLRLDSGVTRKISGGDITILS